MPAPPPTVTIVASGNSTVLPYARPTDCGGVASQMPVSGSIAAVVAVAGCSGPATQRS